MDGPDLAAPREAQMHFNLSLSNGKMKARSSITLYHESGSCRRHNRGGEVVARVRAQSYGVMEMTKAPQIRRKTMAPRVAIVACMGAMLHNIAMLSCSGS